MFVSAIQSPLKIAVIPLAPFIEIPIRRLESRNKTALALSFFKGGDYFYSRMKNFFDSRSIPYQTKRVIYDISDTGEELNSEKIYKLTQRVKEYKKGEFDDEE